MRIICNKIQIRNYYVTIDNLQQRRDFCHFISEYNDAEFSSRREKSDCYCKLFRRVSSKEINVYHIQNEEKCFRKYIHLLKKFLSQRFYRELIFIDITTELEIPVLFIFLFFKSLVST